MENLCDIPAEKLPFEFMGLCLQEPMALVTNWLVASVAFIIYFRFTSTETPFQKHWKLFYLFIGLSTFFSGFGHVFFQYTDVFGKYPTWVLGIVSAFHASKAMLSLNIINSGWRKLLLNFCYAKAVAFSLAAVVLQSFAFIMVDAVLTYIIFCLGLGLYYWKKGLNSFKYTVIAVLILTPSIFIFTLQYNPHLWFNKEDLSHIIMATTIIFFYFGVSRFNQPDLDRLISLKELKYVNK